jgi:hypothetical protein
LHTANHHPANNRAATAPTQMNYALSPAHAQSDSNAMGLSQSISAMAIDPSSRHHTRAYGYAAYAASSGHRHPSQHASPPPPPSSPPHPYRASTSASAAPQAPGRHLGTRLLTMTPVHHSHGKLSGSGSGSALTSDEDAPTDEPSTEGSSCTSSSSFIRNLRTPHPQAQAQAQAQACAQAQAHAHGGGHPPSDALGYRPSAVHYHRASMPAPQRKAKEERDGCGTADSVRQGGGSPGGGLTIRTPGVRI